MVKYKQVTFIRARKGRISKEKDAEIDFVSLWILVNVFTFESIKRDLSYNPATDGMDTERERDMYLSLEMEQSMTVRTSVLRMIKGSWMTEPGGGRDFEAASLAWFLFTRFLKAICCSRIETEWSVPYVACTANTYTLPWKLFSVRGALQ